MGRCEGKGHEHHRLDPSILPRTACSSPGLVVGPRCSSCRSLCHLICLREWRRLQVSEAVRGGLGNKSMGRQLTLCFRRGRLREAAS